MLSFYNQVSSLCLFYEFTSELLWQYSWQLAITAYCNPVVQFRLLPARGEYPHMMASQRSLEPKKGYVTSICPSFFHRIGRPLLGIKTDEIKPAQVHDCGHFFRTLVRPLGSHHSRHTSDTTGNVVLQGYPVRTSLRYSVPPPVGSDSS